jgi:hypothetical protein
LTVSAQRKIVITNEKEFAERKKKVCKQLENLKKQTFRGKISETISSKLRELIEDFVKVLIAFVWFMLCC